jgi:hypothetical protein
MLKWKVLRPLQLLTVRGGALFSITVCPELYTRHTVQHSLAYRSCVRTLSDYLTASSKPCHLTANHGLGLVTHINMLETFWLSIDYTQS